MNRRLKMAGLVVMALAAGGCLNEKRSYEVSVHNGLDEPITVWLTKEYGPDEIGWESPEEVGLQNPEEDSAYKLPDMVVPAGKVGHRGPVTGEFDKLQGRAYLRVYQGTPTLTQMLATDRSSSNRADVMLVPGVNRVEVDDKGGYLSAHRLGLTAPTTEPAAP